MKPSDQDPHIFIDRMNQINNGLAENPKLIFRKQLISYQHVLIRMFVLVKLNKVFLFSPFPNEYSC